MRPPDHGEGEAAEADSFDALHGTKQQSLYAGGRHWQNKLRLCSGVIPAAGMLDVRRIGMSLADAQERMMNKMNILLYAAISLLTNCVDLMVVNVVCIGAEYIYMEMEHSRAFYLSD